ncbi:T-cell antigen CD7 [Microtus ochrogaster]|uniref:T-cell antigen CD7 n=1 Tax=Microtus ochrogaster TaxID=79684 RepID=A0ABM0KQS5_MICOH|nr:T-cell antigen CD7 [Microtus ochrogaster]
MSKDSLPVLLLTLAMVLPGPLDAQEIKIASEGNSINITCSTSEDLQGIYLKKTWPKTWPKNENVIYFEDGENPTVNETFTGRIDFSGSQSNLTITMRLLRQEDSGIYTCHANTKTKKDGPSTMVVVTEKVSLETYRSQEPQGTSISLLAVMAVGFFLIGLVFGMLCMLRKTQIKELCAPRKKDSRCVVYEDMSYKHKTPCALNPYQ